MRLLSTSRPVRSGLAAAALLAVAACSAQINGPTAEDLRGAGRDFGETLRDTVGARATDAELETLCGEGAMEEGIVTEGREGDETDVEVDEFITACRKAALDQ